MPANHACTACPLHDGVNTVCVWGTGPRDAKIMLIGEGPGVEEDRTGKPFQGDAGQKLTEALNDAGIKRSSVYITNVVKCRPPGNRTPTQAEAATCAKYLIEEIQDVNPEYIVAMGGTAMKLLVGTDKVGAEHGKILTPRHGLYFDSKIVPTYHPAASLYQGGGRAYAALVNDLRVVSNKVTGNDDSQIGEVLVFPPNPDDGELMDALRRIRNNGSETMAVDLEWTKGEKSMIWPWTGSGRIWSMSLTVDDRETEDVLNASMSWPPTDRVRKAVHWLLRNKKCVFHNAMADGLWLAADGVPDFDLAGDTMLRAYLLDERQGLSLDAVATKYSPDVEPGWKGHLFAQEPRGDEWDEILKYNAEDTYSTLKGWQGLGKVTFALSKERREAVLRLERLILLPATRVLQKAAIAGVPIDKEQLQIEIDASHERQNKAANELADTIGITPRQAIELTRSADKTKDFISGALGIKLDSSNKDALAELIKYPAVASILRVRKETKFLSTYGLPWMTMLERQGDGRLHSVYKLLLRTGRTSAETELGGSVQVAPREKWLRRLVKATKGRKIVGGDLQTVEMRVAAVYANEDTMLRFFAEGIDLHTATAAFIVACRTLGYAPDIGEWWADRQRWMAPIAEEYKRTGYSEDRQQAKGTNFGLVYDMQIPKLMHYVKTKYGVVLTTPQATQVYNSYFRLYSKLKPWHEQSMLDAERLGYTETFFGRRRHYDKGDVHAAINSNVQSVANDFNLLAMINAAALFEEEGLDAVIIGVIHDSIMVDTADRDVPRVKQLLKWCMENVDTDAFGFRFPIPLPADVKEGQSWGD